MSSIPTIAVTKAVRDAESSLSLETLRHAYDPRPEVFAAIGKAYVSYAYEFVCASCADYYGTRYPYVDATIREEWYNVAIITGNLGVSWSCDSCEKSVVESSAYLYIPDMI